MNWEVPGVQAGFIKGRRIRDQIANIHWIVEKTREIEKSIYICLIDYAKMFDCVDHNKLWNTLKRWEYHTILTVSWVTCPRVNKQQLQPYMQQLTGSGLRKEYDKAVYCHSVYLTYM